LNILLTGGAGYIGSHSAIFFSEAGHNIFILDNLVNSSSNVILDLDGLLKKKVNFIFGDIRDEHLVSNILSKNNIECVVHFAGLKSVAASVQKPLDYFSTNIHGTISVLQAMSLNNVKKFIFSSSATIYGDPEYLPIDEAHILHPQNPYGESKMIIERLLLELARADSSWRIASLRYFNPIGAHPSGIIGEKPNGVPNNLLPLIINVALGKNRELLIFGNDYDTHDGTGIRDYIHVMDLAEAHLSALNFLELSIGCNIFNLGTGKGYSVLEIIRAFELVSSIKIPFKYVNRRAGDVAISFAAFSKAEKYLKWKPRRDIVEMCRSAWMFAKNQGKL
jgi:UDP-glucose 4-epimerase